MSVSNKTNRKRKRNKIVDDNNNDEPKSKRRRKLKSQNKSDSKNNENDEYEMKQTEQQIVFILAHGAGTNSKHPNMQNWKERLSKLGKVVTFDFKRPFNRMPKLIETYQSVIDSTIKKYPNHELILIGCSMGSRVAIHLSLTNSFPNNCKRMIALGYPLYVKRNDKIRTEPLLEFINNSNDDFLKQTRLLLISGTKDPMAPKDIMNEFYKNVKNIKIENGDKNKCELHWIDGANHSLKVGKRHSLGQDVVYQNVIDIISNFI